MAAWNGSVIGKYPCPGEAGAIWCYHWKSQLKNEWSYLFIKGQHVSSWDKEACQAGPIWYKFCSSKKKKICIWDSQLTRHCQWKFFIENFSVKNLKAFTKAIYNICVILHLLLSGVILSQPNHLIILHGLLLLPVSTYKQHILMFCNYVFDLSINSWLAIFDQVWISSLAGFLQWSF